MKKKLTKSEIEASERTRFYRIYKNEDIRNIIKKLYTTSENELTDDENLMNKILMTRNENFINYSRINLIMMENFLNGFISQNPISKTELLVYLESIKNAILKKG
ncbi:hypothetical protein NAT51_16660 [Flavobacterium amniphilum]|uniref:hypothetical protein n=1 Tax=Flavobacterium amniphilum TaxID=1834035 RepID=UPI00202A966E|nr:hypothetical protein [Flavobacterium amniphilum]MCL9807167.1 hypothetical protein [Flavobacterium amniphilum]